jgi:hypothetical protein
VAAFAVDIARQVPQPQDDGSLIRGDAVEITVHRTCRAVRRGFQNAQRFSCGSLPRTQQTKNSNARQEFRSLHRAEMPLHPGGWRHGARAHVKPPMGQQITPYVWVHPGDDHKAYGAPLIKRVPFRYSARSTVACSIAAGIFATDISDRAT